MTGRQLIEQVTGDTRIAQAIYEAGYVCVPVVPTEDMLDGAYYEALSESARGVWETMIGVSEGTGIEKLYAMRESRSPYPEGRFPSAMKG